MTEEQQLDEPIGDPVFALRVLIGEAARMMREEPHFWADPTFKAFLGRVSPSWGFSVDQILDCIQLADLIVPTTGDPEANRGIIFRALEVVTGRSWL